LPAAKPVVVKASVNLFVLRFHRLSHMLYRTKRILFHVANNVDFLPAGGLKSLTG